MLWVDGDLVEVEYDVEQGGTYHYTRIGGPDPGHGFSVGTNLERWADMTDHLDRIRWFLSEVDPVTGHLEDD